jgi:DNA polymerase-3 subunit chi
MPKPKVDFYLIPAVAEKERLAFACRLVEKAYQQQHRVYIHAGTQANAHQMDEILWTYREDSFLPHNLYGEGPDTAPPIQIGFNAVPEKHRDILINLDNTVPGFYTQFIRVFELVLNEPADQAAARERYKAYRAQGCEITTHKLQSTVEV